MTDTQNLQNLAANITRHVNVFKSETYSTTDPRASDFVVTGVQLSELKASICDARVRLQEASHFLMPANAGQNNQLQVNAIQNEVQLADRTAETLSRIVEVQQRFASLDAGRNTTRESCNEIVDTLSSISQLPNDDTTSEMIQSVKCQYHQRRAKYSSMVKRLLRQAIRLRQNGVDISPSTTAIDDQTQKLSLSDIFDCASTLGILEKETKAVAQNLASKVVSPMLECAREASRLNKPGLEVCQEESGLTMTWMFSNRDDILPKILRGGDENSNPNMGSSSARASILPVLLSFLRFLRQHVGGGDQGGKVLQIVGEVIWPPISKELVLRFETATQEDAFSAAQLETEAEQLGFTKDDTLRRQLDHAQGAVSQVKKIELLAAARSKMLSEDLTTVRVQHDDSQSLVSLSSDDPIVAKLGDDPLLLHTGYMKLPEFSVTSVQELNVLSVKFVFMEK